MSRVWAEAVAMAGEGGVSGCTWVCAGRPVHTREAVPPGSSYTERKTALAASGPCPHPWWMDGAASQGHGHFLCHGVAAQDRPPEALPHLDMSVLHGRWGAQQGCRALGMKPRLPGQARVSLEAALLPPPLGGAAPGASPAVWPQSSPRPADPQHHHAQRAQATPSLPPKVP